MLYSKIDKSKPKGWLMGPWNSRTPVAVGYANQGISEKHYHKQMFEIYLLVHGTSTVIVENKRVELRAGDVLVVEPREVHSFIESSADYLHFVIHVPFVEGDKVQMN